MEKTTHKFGADGAGSSPIPRPTSPTMMLRKGEWAGHPRHGPGDNLVTVTDAGGREVRGIAVYYDGDELRGLGFSFSGFFDDVKPSNKKKQQGDNFVGECFHDDKKKNRYEKAYVGLSPEERFTRCQLWVDYQDDDNPNFVGIRLETSLKRTFEAGNVDDDWWKKEKVSRDVDTACGVLLGFQIDVTYRHEDGGSEPPAARFNAIRLVHENSVRSFVISEVKFNEFVVPPPSKPVIVGAAAVVNRSSEPTTMSAPISAGWETQTHWTASLGIKLGIKGTITAGIPQVGEAGLEVSTEFSFGYEWGETETKSTTMELSTGPLVVPANQYRRVLATVGMAKVSVPFTAKAVLTYENGESETIRIEDGVYEGVMAFDLALQVQDSTPLGKDGLPVFSGTIPGPMFGGPKRVAGLTDELANMARQQVVVVHYE